MSVLVKAITIEDFSKLQPYTLPNPHIEKIRELASQGLYGAEIARKIGISRERVRQLTIKHNITLSPKPHLYTTCTCCGTQCWESNRKPGFLSEQSKKTSLCVSCYRKTLLISTICFICGKVTWFTGSRYLIQTQTRRVIKGKVYERRTAPWFCSKRCQGKYTGIYYGFVSHPENTRKKWPPYQMLEEKLCESCNVVKKASEFRLSKQQHLLRHCKKCQNKIRSTRKALGARKISMEEYEWLRQYHLW